jgi:AraC family transcriptional regulator
MFTEQSVIRTAIEAGYDSNEAFTRVFKRTFGSAPSRFRRAHLSDLVTAGEGPSNPRPECPAAARLPGSGDVVAGQRPGGKLVYFRFFGPYRERLTVWGRVLEYATARGLVGRPRLIGIVHDHPDLAPSGRVRYDACIVVDRSYTPDDAVGLQWLPDREYLVARHIGLGGLMPNTYIRLINSWALGGRRPHIRPVPIFELFDGMPPTHTTEEVAVDLCVSVDQEGACPRGGSHPRGEHAQ